MSEQQPNPAANASTLEADDSRFADAERMLLSIPFGDRPIALDPSNETIQSMPVATNPPTFVLRYRHTVADPSNHDKSRQDVYFALHIGRLGVEQRLTVLVDDLAEEHKAEDTGDFDAILPRRRALARRAAAGNADILPDMHVGSHEDVRELLRVLHAADSVFRHR